MMQAFLMAAHDEGVDSMVVKVWVKQVRDVAYDVEDSLQELAVRLQKQSWWRIHQTLLDRRRVAKQMKELRANVEDVSQRNMRYHLIKGSSSKPATIGGQSAVADGTTMSGTAEVMRLREKAKVDLVRLINKKDNDLIVIAVSGTSAGHLGKMSIIKDAYEDPMIQKKFECRAWIGKLIVSACLGDRSVSILRRDSRTHMIWIGPEGPQQPTPIFGDLRYVHLHNIFADCDLNCICFVASVSSNLEVEGILIAVQVVAAAKCCICLPMLMEATALSIGKSVLNGALNYAKSALAEEVALQLGVRRDQIFITNELEMMQAFLMAAHDEGVDSMVVKVWVKQVRDVAYDVEDSLQELAVRLQKQSWWRIHQTLLDRRRVAKQMKELRANVEDVSQRNMRYHLIKGSSSKPATIGGQSAVADGTTMSGTAEVMRLREKAKVDLVRLINKKDNDLIVIAVSGTSAGHLGKMSIIKDAYEDPMIQKKFECRAWIGKLMCPFNLTEFLQSIIEQFHVNFLQESGEKERKSFGDASSKEDAEDEGR
ncbi:hypothetical protein ACQ4PT_065082 [Festuca glaucescens]